MVATFDGMQPTMEAGIPEKVFAATAAERARTSVRRKPVFATQSLHKWVLLAILTWVLLVTLAKQMGLAGDIY